MEHRNKIEYLGYDILVYINHQGDLFVTIELDGTPLDCKVGNTTQAEYYIEDLVFERDGFLFGESRFRISEDEFIKFENTPKIKELAIGHNVGKKMKFLANACEMEVVGRYLGQDITENCYDYFSVYCGSKL